MGAAEKRLSAELEATKAECDRLRRILDSRPAINAGLPESYIEWTHGVYLSDILAHSGKRPS